MTSYVHTCTFMLYALTYFMHTILTVAVSDSHVGNSSLEHPMAIQQFINTKD